jgi:serine/threonine protein kinase
MTGETDGYARVHEILNHVRLFSGGALDAHLAEACGDDLRLHARVLELLAAGMDADASDVYAERSIACARLALDQLLDGATANWLPEKIGEYCILRRIDPGGMSLVFEAEQASPPRRVAIKLLHPAYATANRARRFRREVEMLESLQHPGIVQVFEAGICNVGFGPQPFFAMELVDGVNICTHCEQHHLTHAARIELLARVADAVHHAHEHGIIHCDLKPDNVLVDWRGDPRILDFGIAHVGRRSRIPPTPLTEDGQLFGTRAYMAPELFFKSPHSATPQVDVYALGVLGFEMLFGRLPAAAPAPSIPRANRLPRSSDPAPSIPSDACLGRDLNGILGKALESEPERRYGSAAALADDIRRHLVDLTIQLGQPDRNHLAHRFVRRHVGLALRMLVTLFSVAAVLIVVRVLAGKATD